MKKKSRKIIKGNHTTVDKNENIVPIYNEMFPESRFYETHPYDNKEEIKKLQTAKGSSRMRDFSIENKK